MKVRSDILLFQRSSISHGCCRPKPKPKPPQCPQLPGTLLRIFIPPGAVINLLNLFEVASPGGICFIIRLPFLGGGSSNAMSMESIVNAVNAAGGSVEFVQ